MGRHHMKGGSEYHFTAQLFRSEQWSNVTLFLLTSYRDYINWVLKYCLVFFFGYVLSAGGIWQGDIMVADIEELEEMDASELHARSSMQRKCQRQWKVKNSYSQSQKEQSKFQQEFKIWEHPPSSGTAQTEEKNKKSFLENQKGLFHTYDSFPDAGEAINDFWSMSGSFIYRHHVEPRVKLYSPREESIPIALKHIDVTRTADTTLDVMSEKHINDYWNVDGDRELSDAWTGFTRFTVLKETPPHGYTRSGREDWRGNKRPQDPTLCGQMCGSICLMHRNAKKSKNGPSRNPNSIMPEIYMLFSLLILMMKNSSVQWKMLVDSWKIRCQQECFVDFN